MKNVTATTNHLFWYTGRGRDSLCTILDGAPDDDDNDGGDLERSFLRESVGGPDGATLRSGVLSRA